MTEVCDPPMLRLKTKRLTNTARLPVRATTGSACLDLHADLKVPGPIEISQGFVAVIGTGIAVELPPGFVMLIFSRSSHGFHNAVRLGNCVGVIDSDYRGEVMVKLVADWHGQLTVNQGDRIAQALILPYPEVLFEETAQLAESARGTGGLGSTGQGAING